MSNTDSVQKVQSTRNHIYYYYWWLFLIKHFGELTSARTWLTASWFVGELVWLTCCIREMKRQNHLTSRRLCEKQRLH